MNYIQTLISTIGLLTLSNIFRFFTWYGHLKFKSYPLYTVIFVSWAIAFFQYCFHVPANRFGHSHLSGIELKTIQEIITMTVFLLFSVLYLKEGVNWNHIIGFVLITIGSIAVFYK